MSKKKPEEIIEKVFKKAAYEKYYDDWINNFALNLNNIWIGKSARELIPKKKNSKSTSSAIVIGRGPSIIKHQHIPLLANSDYKGTIICADGALKLLLKEGITPKKFKKFFVVTIDTQEHAKNLYSDPVIKKYGKKIKCLLSTTVPPTTYKVIKKTGMKIYWLHTLFDYNLGKSSFNYISGIMTRSKNHDRGLPAIQTGGNVGTSAWVASWSILKCNPVALIGIDLGYPIDTTWEEICNYHKLPKEIKDDSKFFKKAFPTVYNTGFKCYCKQDPKFQFYSNALKEFIPKASKFVKTINATEGGSVFGKGIKCMTFKNFLKSQKAV